jgi:hypothetical protein
MQRPPVFQITVDTEGDNLWLRPRKITTANAHFLPRFQALCERYNFKPTYLVNWEMANDPIFQDFGRDVIVRETGEIGMHLHAWNSPPVTPLTSDDYQFHPYLVEFPIKTMREKVKVMTACLEDTFGVKMLTHRAGRWAFNETYARLLADFGYICDCSVTPYVSWRSTMGDPSGQGGSDYTKFPTTPFVMDFGSDRRIVEVPMTVGCNPVSILEQWARKALGKSISIAWLRPNGHNLTDMLRILDLRATAGAAYVQFMLHSSEFMPGGSPTFDSESKIEHLYEHLELLLEEAAKKFAGATVSEYVATRMANPETAFRFSGWPDEK